MCVRGCVCVLAPQGRRGDLLVSLCYNPTANTITVNIIKARNLKAMDIGGTSGGSFHLPSPLPPTPPSSFALHYSACGMFERSECIMGRRASVSPPVESRLLLPPRGLFFCTPRGFIFSRLFS